jgi:hypothetical protein
MICFAHEEMLEMLEISNSGNMPTDLTLFTNKKYGGDNF